MKLLKIMLGAALCSGFLNVGSDVLGANQTAPAEAKKGKPYPLKTCVVTDEKLGEMGKPYVYKHETREVQFCCKGCLKDFQKQPAKYLKKIDAAEKKAKPSAPGSKNPSPRP